MDNDKLWVIAVLFGISICLCFRDIPTESINLLNNIISGLLGAAGMSVRKDVQKVIKKNKTNNTDPPTSEDA